MLKTIEKITLSCLSVLGLTCLMWTVLLLNPSLSYANKSQFDNVTIYHNLALEDETESVIIDVLSLIMNAAIYDENTAIQLCLNDDKIYPNLHPFAGGLAYAFLNKALIYDSKQN